MATKKSPAQAFSAKSTTRARPNSKHPSFAEAHRRSRYLRYVLTAVYAREMGSQARRADSQTRRARRRGGAALECFAAEVGKRFATVVRFRRGARLLHRRASGARGRSEALQVHVAHGSLFGRMTDWGWHSWSLQKQKLAPGVANFCVKCQLVRKAAPNSKVWLYHVDGRWTSKRPDCRLVHQ